MPANFSNWLIVGSVLAFLYAEANVRKSNGDDGYCAPVHAQDHSCMNGLVVGLGGNVHRIGETSINQYDIDPATVRNQLGDHARVVLPSDPHYPEFAARFASQSPR